MTERPIPFEFVGRSLVLHVPVERVGEIVSKYEMVDKKFTVDRYIGKKLKQQSGCVTLVVQHPVYDGSSILLLEMNDAAYKRASQEATKTKLVKDPDAYISELETIGDFQLDKILKKI